MENRISLIAMAVLLLVSCRPQEKAMRWDNYTRWLASHQEYLAKTNTVNEISVKVSRQPTDYLAYKELKNSNIAVSKAKYDSVKASYGCSASFKIVVSTENTNLNLLRYKVATREDYNARINYLSFHTEEFITMKIGEQVLTPAIANYEMYSELSNTIAINVVFVPPEKDCDFFLGGHDKVTLAFNDPVWDTGKHNFVYTKNDWEKIPTLKI